MNCAQLSEECDNEMKTIPEHHQLIFQMQLEFIFIFPLLYFISVFSSEQYHYNLHILHSYFVVLRLSVKQVTLLIPTPTCVPSDKKELHIVPLRIGYLANRVVPSKGTIAVQSMVFGGSWKQA